MSGMMRTKKNKYFWPAIFLFLAFCMIFIGITASYVRASKENTIKYVSELLTKGNDSLKANQQSKELIEGILTNKNYQTGQKTNFALETTELFNQTAGVPVYNTSLSIESSTQEEITNTKASLINNNKGILDIYLSQEKNNVSINIPQISDDYLIQSINEDSVFKNVSSNEFIYYELLSYSPFFVVVKNADPNINEFLPFCKEFILCLINHLPETAFKIEWHPSGYTYIVSAEYSEITSALSETLNQYCNDSYFKSLIIKSLNINDDEYATFLNSFLSDLSEVKPSNSFCTFEISKSFFSKIPKNVLCTTISKEKYEEYKIINKKNKLEFVNTSSEFDEKGSVVSNSEKGINFIYSLNKNELTGIADVYKDNDHLVVYLNTLRITNNEIVFDAFSYLNSGFILSLSCEAHVNGDISAKLNLSEADYNTLLKLSYDISPSATPVEFTLTGQQITDSDAYWESISESDYVDFVSAELHFDSLFSLFTEEAS